MEALDDEPDQDFLGEMFMGLNLGNHWKGQFFTPYNICRMMSEITVTDLEARIEKNGWVGIHDPCCGAGALLIAARNTMVRNKLGPAVALYVAQDIDRTAALMCYLQLSLFGLCRLCGGGGLHLTSHCRAWAKPAVNFPHPGARGLVDACPLHGALARKNPMGADAVGIGKSGSNANRPGT